MGLKYIKITFFIFLSLVFQACSFNNNSVRSVIQTNSASQIENYKNNLLDDLIEYKIKLDLRNPFSYNKKLKYDIIREIRNKENYIKLLNVKSINNYKKYLYYAFSKDKIKNRNDFLILGIYKLIFKSYDLYKSHKFIAMQYNKEELQNLYKYLQVIRWKIRTLKDKKGDYLFKTWQNNWQLELAKKDLENLNIIKDLEYIKLRKESIFSHSNFSFEILMSNMIYNVKLTLKKINVEPFEMGTSALKSFIFMI